MKFIICISDSDWLGENNWYKFKIKNSCFGIKLFSLYCLLIEFAISNPILIYFCISEISKTNIWNQVLTTEYWITFWIWGRGLWYSQMLFCSQCNKTFWYTNIFLMKNIGNFHSNNKNHITYEWISKDITGIGMYAWTNKHDHCKINHLSVSKS